MDDRTFDALAKSLGGGVSRRGLLAAAAVLTSRAARPGSAAACCGPDRDLGQECRCDCQCPRGVHCGKARPAADRPGCGQDPAAATVCCRGQHAACTSDCECCGALACQGGVCRPTCNAITCPHGCCDAGGCRSGNADAACGRDGADCTACPAGQVCRDGACGACGQGGPCLVFVTSSTHTGALGGLTGADAVCQNLAAAARLSGVYRAWLADATGAPATRFTRNPGPYRLVDGTKVAGSWTALTKGALAHAIDQTETGQLARGAVWSHVQPDGQAAASDRHCGNWTVSDVRQFGDFGSSTVKGESWTASATVSCDGAGQPTRLYCFQQAD